MKNRVCAFMGAMLLLLFGYCGCGEPVPAPIPEPQPLVVEITPTGPAEPEPVPEEAAPQPPAWPATGIFGSVQNLEGRAQPGAEVRIFDKKNHQHRQTADEWGRFHFENPEPGPWWIEASWQDQISFGDKSQIPLLKLDQTPAKPVELKMRPAAQLLVRVLSRENRIPLEHAQIRVVGLDRTQQTNEKGEITLFLSPDIWDLEISAPYHQPQRAMAGFSATPTPFEVSLKPLGELPDQLKQKEAAPFDINLAPVVVISGEVVDEQGKRLPTCRILPRAGSELVEAIHCDEKGNFSFKKPQELQALVFSAPGYLSYHHTGPWDRESLTIVLKKMLNFYARVVNKNTGQPVPEFTLNKSENNQGFEIRDADGRLVLENRHPSDPIFLTISARGYQENQFGPYQPDVGTAEAPVLLELVPIQ